MKYLLVILFLLFTTQAQADLVGWWKMDEASWNGTANEVVDSSGSGNHGTASGAITKPGKDNRAGYFDGSDDYVNAGSSSSLDNIDVKTIEAWIYIVDWSAQFLTILAKSTCGGSPKGFNFFEGNQGQLGFRQSFSGATSAYWAVSVGSAGLALNKWFHVALVYDRTSDANDPVIYVNGVSKTVFRGTAASGTAESDANENFLIGSECPSYYQFSGYIDDVRIYNEALTATQIQQHYNEGAQTHIRNTTIKNATIR